MQKKYWSYLIHLAENMWSDTPNSRMWGFRNWPDGAGYRDKVLCDDEIWDKLISEFPKFGINTLVVDVGDAIRFESHPELAIEGSWSKEKLDKKLSEARSAGLTVIPKLNFSACHDIWLKEYSRMLSTSIYYRVVEDLISETCELFGNPELFHLGMDEEDFNNQKTYDYCVIRHGDLWWHDLKFMCDVCNKSGARPWVWSDICWNHMEDFKNKMPRDVVQSNWYYGNDFAEFRDGFENTTLAAFEEIDKLGFDQIPTGSNWTWLHNVEQLAAFCKDSVSPEHLMGYMVAPWAFTHKKEYYRLMDAASKLGNAIDILK